uniref:Hexokinase type 2 n=1 Tax=Lygus hesperus TaxID=30085 RepID=A0A0A9YPA6_LYGHE
MKHHKVCPVFKKASRKATSYLRHLAVDASMNGTKSLLFRAGRYSVHQFFKSFAAMFTVLLILPKAVKQAFNSATKHPFHFPGFGSGIFGAIKGAFVGIPSLFRSGFAAIKVQLYGVTASIYHFIETIKAFFIVITGRFSHFNQLVHHAVSTMTVNLKASMSAISLMFSHLFTYVSSVFQSFTTGTSNAMHNLWEKEKNWGVHVFERFEHGRDYVSKGLWHVFASIGSGFAKMWAYLTSFGGGVKHKVNEVAVTVGHKVHDTAADVGHKMHDAAVDVGQVFQKVHDKAANVRHTVHDQAADVRHKVHDAAIHGLHSVGDAEHRVFVKFKTTADLVRHKASDLATGVKVGTSHIYHKVKDGVPVIGEKAVLILRTSKVRGQHLVHVGVEKGKHAASHVKTSLSKGSQDLIWFFRTLGKKTHHVFVVVTRPLVYPVVYVAHVPGNVVHAVCMTPVTVYLYFMSVIGLIAYLGLAIKTRYDREQYARKVGIHKKVRNGCQELNLSDSVLRQCMEKLRAQIDLGLNPSTREQASVKCYNTYVQDLPTGKEKGPISGSRPRRDEFQGSAHHAERPSFRHAVEDLRRPQRDHAGPW